MYLRVMEMTNPSAKGAPQYMRQMGRKTDVAVLAEVEKNPGSRIKEMAERLKWTNGRVDGSVNRLISQEKVKVRHFLRMGVLVKRVYPIDYELAPSRLFEIPRELIREDLWTRNVRVYAVSRSTIGLSPVPREEWEHRAPMKDEANIAVTEDMLRFELPESFMDFYHLENSETSLSLIGDSAIITVEATVIPVDVPPEYPEITVPEGQYMRLEGIVVEKTPTTTTYKRLVFTSDKEEEKKQVEFEKDININALLLPATVEKIDTSGARLIVKPIEV